jgi:hypothetical protein
MLLVSEVVMVLAVVLGILFLVLIAGSVGAGGSQSPAFGEILEPGEFSHRDGDALAASAESTTDLLHDAR